MIVREIAPTLLPGAYLIGVGPDAAAIPYDELRIMVPRAITNSTKASPSPAGRYRGRS